MYLSYSLINEKAHTKHKTFTSLQIEHRELAAPVEERELATTEKGTHRTPYSREQATRSRAREKTGEEERGSAEMREKARQ